jgi:hypothetical protein
MNWCQNPAGGAALPLLVMHHAGIMTPAFVINLLTSRCRAGALICDEPIRIGAPLLPPPQLAQSCNVSSTKASKSFLCAQRSKVLRLCLKQEQELIEHVKQT